MSLTSSCLYTWSLVGGAVGGCIASLEEVGLWERASVDLHLIAALCVVLVIECNHP